MPPPDAHTVRLRVRVQPKASRTGIDGVYQGMIRVRVQAPPVDGAANDALVDLLAATLGVPRRHVRIVAGLAARNKTVEVDGPDRRALDRLLSAT